MRSLFVLCIAFICVTARIPFIQYAPQAKDEKDPHDSYFIGSVRNRTFFPFQRTVVINETNYSLTPTVYYNETFLHVSAQFLGISNEGEMVPDFSIPLNGSVMTVRLHTMACYPEQGGSYYRYNTTQSYGEQDNELVGTRATDENGVLTLDVHRPWPLLVSNTQSLVITSATDGVVLCTNIDWQQVDGAFSSAVSVVSLLAVIGLLAKQMFLG